MFVLRLRDSMTRECRLQPAGDLDGWRADQLRYATS